MTKETTRVCTKCGAEFALQQGKPGYANVCPTCTESPETHTKRAEAQAAMRERRIVSEKVNERTRQKAERDKRVLETMGYEVVRQFRISECLEGDDIQGETFGMHDQVSVLSESGIWTIVGTRSEEPKFLVQLGPDAATQKYVQTSALKLIEKYTPPDSGPGFAPTRSIMD